MITVEEILSAIAEASPTRPANEEGVYTARELAELAGLSKWQMRQRLTALREQGRVVQTEKWIPTAAGVWTPVPAYRFVRGRDSV